MGGAKNGATMSDAKLPYSPVREVNGTYYVSGQLPIDHATGAMPDSIEEQTHAALVNLEGELSKCGLNRENVVKTTVFMRDFDQFSAMNEVYRDFFSDPYPARSAFSVTGLAAGAMIEIEAIAAKIEE